MMTVKIYEIDFKDERHCAFFMKCGKAVSYSLVLRHAHKIEIEENIRIVFDLKFTGTFIREGSI